MRPVLFVIAVLIALSFGAFPAGSQVIDDPAAQMKEWFPDEEADWLLAPPESIVLCLSDVATVMTDPSVTPLVGDVLKLGPRPARFLDTPESLAWEAAVKALGPTPFKYYEKEAFFEWVKKYKELGPKPEPRPFKDNSPAYDKWNLDFLRIMQKYGALHPQPGTLVPLNEVYDENTVNDMYPPFLEVLRLRLYEALGYSVEGINVFKVQTEYGWYKEVYYLLKRKLP